MKNSYKIKKLYGSAGRGYGGGGRICLDSFVKICLRHSPNWFISITSSQTTFSYIHLFIKY